MQITVSIFSRIAFWLGFAFRRATTFRVFHHLQPFLNDARLHGFGPELKHHVEQGHTGHEHPQILVPLVRPPALFEPDFPIAIEAGADRVQKRSPRVLAIDKGPEPTDEAAPKPSGLGQEGPRQEVLAQADAAPRRPDGACDEDGRSEHAAKELVELVGRIAQDVLVSW